MSGGERFLEPLDPEGSPREKLMIRRMAKRLWMEEELTRELDRENIDPEIARPIARALARFSDIEDRELARLVEEFEEWANQHSH